MGAINSEKLRDTMNEVGFSSARMAKTINEKYPDEKLQYYHIDNIVHNTHKKLSDKTLKKLEMISEVLNRPISTFLNTNHHQVPKEKVAYNGKIFRQSAELVEEVFSTQNIQPSLGLIKQYSQDAHNFAVKNGIDDPKMIRMYIEGTVGSSIRAGMLKPSTP